MLSILDSTRTEIGEITDYEDLEIVHSLEDGDATISFTYLGTTKIENEQYVRTDTARYTIKEAAPQEGKTVYHGQLDLEDLQRVPLKQFTSTGQDLKTAAEAVLKGTGWTVSTNITTKRNVQKFKKTPLELLYAIRDAWMCEIAFDNLRCIVTFAEKLGSDKGVYLMRGLNLKNASPTIDSYDYVTRLIPYGNDGLTIESVNDGIPYVENYQYSTKILTKIWEDTSYTDAQTLKDDAEKKLQDLSRPKKSYSCEVLSLAKMSGTYQILDYAVGDTVTLIDEVTDTYDKQRIVKYTEHPDHPENDTCELSNTVLTFEELQNRLSKATDAWEEISNADGTVNGVYVHGVQAGDVVGIETVITENAEVRSGVSNVSILYAQGDSTQNAPEEGWSEKAPVWDSGKYVWQKTVTKLKDGTVSESDPACLSGAKGPPGEDAVMLYIDSSNGNVFKNSSIATTLTVTIIKGEQTANSSEEMYKMFGNSARLVWKCRQAGEISFSELDASDSRLSDNGFILTLNTDDINERAVFNCDLYL